MDNTYSCIFIILVFVAITLTALFRCRIKCGGCSSEPYMDFLPTTGTLPTGDGGYILEGDNLGAFDYVNNTTCLQCWRDYSDYNICAPYCTQGFTI